MSTGKTTKSLTELFSEQRKANGIHNFHEARKRLNEVAPTRRIARRRLSRQIGAEIALREQNRKLALKQLHQDGDK